MKESLDAPFEERAEFKNQKNRYQIKLAELFNNENALQVLESSEDIPVSLKDIYVRLRIDKKEIKAIESSEEVNKIEGEYLENLLEKSSFVALSGMPGSGKSTLTKYFATSVADNIPNEVTSTLGRRLVIPIILRELDFTSINSLNSLWDFWLSDTSKKLDLSLTRDFFDHYIAQGWAIIILDGLDEIDEDTNQKLLMWIGEYSKKITRNRITNTETKIVLTARPTGYLDGIDYSMFNKFYIQPFNDDQIKQFVDKFFAIRYKHNKVQYKEKVLAFLDKLERFEGLIELKHRPIYLSMLGYISEVDGELPQTRALAYSRMIEAYIHQLDMQKNFDERKRNIILPTWSRTDRLSLIEELAYKIHTKADKENDHTQKASEKVEHAKQMQIQITRDELEQYFIEILKENQFQSIKVNEVEVEKKLAEYFLARTGLLIEPKSGYIQFSHLSFQEYLVASRIYRKQKKRDYENYLKKEIFQNLPRVGWQEIAQLFFGIDSLRQGEEQETTLHFVIDENELSHHQFLLNLFFLTEHKINDEDVLKWLKTILFLWLHGKLYIRCAFAKMFFTELKKRYSLELYNEVAEFFLSISIRQLESDKFIPNNNLIDIVGHEKDENGEYIDLGYRLNDVLKKEFSKAKFVEKMLLIGLYEPSFNKKFFNLESIKKIGAYKNIETVSVLNQYIANNHDFRKDLSKVMFSFLSQEEFLFSISSSLDNTDFKYLPLRLKAVFDTLSYVFRALLYVSPITKHYNIKNKTDKEELVKQVKNLLNVNPFKDTTREIGMSYLNNILKVCLDKNIKSENINDNKHFYRAFFILNIAFDIKSSRFNQIEYFDVASPLCDNDKLKKMYEVVKTVDSISMYQSEKKEFKDQKYVKKFYEIKLACLFAHIVGKNMCGTIEKDGAFENKLLEMKSDYKKYIINHYKELSKNEVLETMRWYEKTPLVKVILGLIPNELLNEKDIRQKFEISIDDFFKDDLESVFMNIPTQKIKD